MEAPRAAVPVGFATVLAVTVPSHACALGWGRAPGLPPTRRHAGRGVGGPCRSDPPPRPQDTDWSEPWLLGLAAFHGLCLLLTCVSFQRRRLQLGHFLCLGECLAHAGACTHAYGVQVVALLVERQKGVGTGGRGALFY